MLEKPAGMSFHSESDDIGVMAYLQNAYPEYTFYPVHRLDKMTSGLLLVACHKAAAKLFGELFEQHQIEKRYLALSNRKPNKKQGTISGGMQVSRRGQWKLTQSTDNFAQTQFFSSYIESHRVFWLRPLTGKTHQIRVALKSLGSPILGDKRYAGESSDRGYLHATVLAFEWQGELVCYRSWPNQGEHFSASLLAQVDQCFDEVGLYWPKSKFQLKLGELSFTERESE
ncbi:pseudouridine synthase [Marinomonas sp. THO17]|uniref:pseudouridine synthase n=1 Tax=Marinomonas sp. THO17 TaxID=3149048 RepID=UPI00336C2238